MCSYGQGPLNSIPSASPRRRAQLSAGPPGSKSLPTNRRTERGNRWRTSGNARISV